ncbi:MAG TPA: class I SAM-dependent methyltransferase [Gaiellaceae bacterium]|nr:class I SAM-dependent methyltransferase [Gaiellaceae bacterium]
MSTDWRAWHAAYEDPSSDLATRLRIVQGAISDVLDSRADRPSRVVSLCAGKGLDVLGVLSSRPARKLVSARLVELDPDLAAAARDAAEAAELENIEVVVADAGSTDSYAGAVPADLVIACGVLGNVSDRDVEATVRAMSSLCAQGGTVVWTRHRRSPDLTTAIRRWFSESGFTEHAFSSPGAESFAVGVHRLETPGEPLRLGEQLFTFTR